jgi:superfamily II DNA or RNA helicase
VLIVINSARKYSSEFTKKGQWMLIVDECHRAASEENRKAMIGSWVATLGLSATPERQYDDWFNEYLIPKLGIVIAEYDYVKAKKDNVIVDFELMNYKVPLTAEESEEIDNLTRSIAIERNSMLESGESESQKLLNLSMKRSRISQRAENRVPLAISICDKFRGRRVLIFHEYTAIADQITRILDERGHRVASYHSKIGDDLRFDNLRMFRDGIIDILVTCKALDEGLNVPDTSVGIIVASTKSVRQRIQRMGRILRTSEGKDLGTIVTLYTHVEKMMLEKESQTLDEISKIKWFGGV